MFSEGVHRVFSECDPDNAASWKLLECLGFTREAYFKQNVYFWKDEDENPIWKDTYVYALLKSRFVCSKLFEINMLTILFDASNISNNYKNERS